ncbi:hypothetical protein XELAEV_18041481mg [Xenopus laevis]|uniref:Fibrinogen C-terminal domain-containing protein n=1 Tax=Xenopus laevis TaxID=8355 RepID=A0A974C2A7_XENLA|nr:hypothetical protein XELAEV_18041481mg [Xenopus laevis]
MTEWLQSFLFLVAAIFSNGVDTHPLPQNCKQWMNQGGTISDYREQKRWTATAHRVSPTSSNPNKSFPEVPSACLESITISDWYLLDTLAGLPMSVFCDMDINGGGWIRGFGHQNSEFWLGNNNLHLLTATGNFQLRIDLTDFSDQRTYASYSNFRIAGESQNYTLSLEGYMGGDAGSSLSEHRGHSFSSKDRDNDLYEGNCAQQYNGAWWYSRCHLSNLNGLYLRGNHTSDANEVNWSSGKGYHYSYKVSEMKFRPMP